MDIFRYLKAADYVTALNFAAGLAAIMLAIQGMFALSAVFALLAVLFDMLDGIVARQSGTQNEFGRQMDTLADIVSFGIWPSVFGYAQGLRSPLAVAVLILFAVCGMLRLARFNVTRIKHFQGVPITVNGVLFPVLYFAFGSFGSWTLFAYATMAILMISSFKVHKLWS
jgi:CDP-diacylglycerol---serine O-phosphatidyltransferase